MCFQDQRSARGDRLQHELFSFVTEEPAQFDFEHAHPDLLELMTVRNEVAELMALEGYRLIETLKNSAADMVGMDLLFISLKDDRYFIIDVTLDAKCKEGLPYLRTESVFVIDVNEDDRLDLDSRRRFLDTLLDLMTSKSVFSIKETPPPNYTTKLSFLDSAEQIENFRKQLDARVANLQREALLEEASAVLGREASQVHEYSMHLARAMAFARAEHVRHSDQEYQVRVAHFAQQMRAAVFESVRAYLGLDTGKSTRSKPTQSTHSAEHKRKLDQVSMRVDGNDTNFILYRMSTLVAEVTKVVCQRTKGATNPNFWAAKHELEHMPAKAKVISDAVTIINSTEIHLLMGIPKKVQKTKTALRKEQKKARLKAQLAELDNVTEIGAASKAA